MKLSQLKRSNIKVTNSFFLQPLFIFFSDICIFAITSEKQPNLGALYKDNCCLPIGISKKLKFAKKFPIDCFFPSQKRWILTSQIAFSERQFCEASFCQQNKSAANLAHVIKITGKALWIHRLQTFFKLPCLSKS